MQQTCENKLYRALLHSVEYYSNPLTFAIYNTKFAECFETHLLYLVRWKLVSSSLLAFQQGGMFFITDYKTYSKHPVTGRYKHTASCDQTQTENKLQMYLSIFQMNDQEKHPEQ